MSQLDLQLLCPGWGEFYRNLGEARLTQLRAFDNWRRTWFQIVAADFGGNGWTDLLFYERPRWARGRSPGSVPLPDDLAIDGGHSGFGSRAHRSHVRRTGVPGG